ncbi:MAG: cyclic nucleotide-binding domain-containing protein [Desulfobacteraceae bacterium]|jgi:CRP-like cAMP-binding protein|nr:cyclic nucleotide-binding domain-containing protein [Desulfobacteraceae bacterium]MBC2753521.1 cyclic nucleotide-binding domain-containing protein [Desulfobacteraceae bacterium]
MLSAQDLIKAPGLLAQEKKDLSIVEKAELIDATRWSVEFSFDQLKKLVRYMSVYDVAQDTVLFCEGEKSAYMVLIIKGRVDVVKFDSQRTPKKITTIGPGKTIGEMSIIDGEPRSASAVTGSDATLFVMTAAQFNGLNEAMPGIGITLALKIAKQMSQYLRQTSGRLIDHLGD